MSSPPQDFQFLFPSSPVQDLLAERDKTYIISTLFRNATLPAWQWLVQTYSKEEMSTVLKTTKTLRKKDVMIWASYLHIPTTEIVCLQTKSQTGLKSSWTY
ncbi:MAG: hypothetical protein ABI758_01170 [Candidatus Woesebacteria bacterium]